MTVVVGTNELMFRLAGATVEMGCISVVVLGRTGLGIGVAVGAMRERGVGSNVLCLEGGGALLRPIGGAECTGGRAGGGGGTRAGGGAEDDAVLRGMAFCCCFLRDERPKSPSNA